MRNLIRKTLSEWEVAKRVNAQPPLTKEEVEWASSELRIRQWRTLHFTVPILWADTPQQFFKLFKLCEIIDSCSQLRIGSIVNALGGILGSKRPLETAINKKLETGKRPSLWQMSRLFWSIYPEPVIRLRRIICGIRAAYINAEALVEDLGIDVIVPPHEPLLRKRRCATLVGALPITRISKKRLEHPHLRAALKIGLTPLCMIALKRPREIHANYDGLHSTVGPAFVSANGVRQCWISGKFYPLISNPDSLSDRQIIKLITMRNVQLRTIAIRMISGERVLKACKAMELDRHGDYILYAPRRYIRAHCLRMRNPTTGALHFEWVPTTCFTIDGALAFRNRVVGAPVVLT